MAAMNLFYCTHMSDDNVTIASKWIDGRSHSTLPINVPEKVPLHRGWPENDFCCEHLSFMTAIMIHVTQMTDRFEYFTFSIFAQNWHSSPCLLKFSLTSFLRSAVESIHVCPSSPSLQIRPSTNLFQSPSSQVIPMVTNVFGIIFENAKYKNRLSTSVHETCCWSLSSLHFRLSKFKSNYQTGS